jgi:hypothetical protein
VHREECGRGCGGDEDLSASCGGNVGEGGAASGPKECGGCLLSPPPISDEKCDTTRKFAAIVSHGLIWGVSCEGGLRQRRKGSGRAEGSRKACANAA